MDLKLDLDPELIPKNGVRWDIEGPRVGAGVDSKLRSKCYNTNMDLEMVLTPQKLVLIW